MNPNGSSPASHLQFRKNLMKSTTANDPSFESTYALIVRSEERPRGLFEMLTYGLLLISTVFAFSQFGRHPFTVPIAAQHSVVQIRT